MYKYYISKNNGKTNHAGSKARNDVENILGSCGYTEVSAALSINNKFLRKLCEYIRYFQLCDFEKNSIVVNQYPNLPFLFNWNLNCKKKKKSYKIVTVIHDLSMRAKGNRLNNRYLQKYVIKISDYIIVHNEKMEQYFIENLGVKKEKIIKLELFDYLMNRCDKEIDSKKGNIIIAGNLDKTKCPYIYKLSDTTTDMKYNLYGPNYCEKVIQDNVSYCGSFVPEELPQNMMGSWGLVWDGTEITTCAGLMGQYLMLNNPHKTSLYIASGIPVIIWNKSALANLIRKKNIGITISSIFDIERKIKSLTIDEYGIMLKNVRAEGAKLRKGYYLKKAINEAEERIRRGVEGEKEIY